MARPSKPLPIVQSESLSADEEKQMQEMKDNDHRQPVEPEPAESKPVDSITIANPEPKEPEKETKNTTVPLAVLEEERSKRKAKEKEAEEQKLENVRLAERVRLINEALTARQPENKPQKVEIPDPEKDALGALKAMTHNSRLTEDENRLLREFQAKTEQQNIVNSQIAEVNRLSNEAAREFMKVSPDYNDAANYLAQSRKAELAHLGYNSAQAERQIAEETLYIAAQALTNNNNPAKAFYEIAKARGYMAKASPVTANQETEADKIIRLAAAQKQNASLSDIQGTGSNSSNLINARDLANMNETQFAAILSKVGKDNDSMKALFGN